MRVDAFPVEWYEPEQENSAPVSPCPGRVDRAHSAPHSLVLVIDNYDSFTFNLVQYLLELGATVAVCANDAASPGELLALAPTHVLLSPGPGAPRDSGVCRDLVCTLARVGHVPVLGVCLGHQVLCEYFGAAILRARRIMHGKTSRIAHDETGLFAGLPRQFQVGRYHSLLVDPATLPACLRCVAETDEGEIMAVAHRDLPMFGVQFHPESILTEYGHAILRTFLRLSPVRLASVAGLGVVAGSGAGASSTVARPSGI